MPTPAETVSAPPDEIRGLSRKPLIEDLRDYSERLGPLLGTTLLPFALVIYLALEGGGYDVVVRSEAGVAIWWIVLLGALVGVLPVQPFGRGELVGLALLLALAGWTALGITWGESSERGVEEVGRVLFMVGVLSLSLSAQRRDGLGRTVRAVGAAIAVVALLALLSRLEPSWISPSETLPEVKARLAYPLNYWNGLAALIAVGTPLLLVIAAESRRLTTQAIATAAIPVMALTAYYTLSRGGAIAIAVALIVLFALHPRRLKLLPTFAIGSAGAALAIAAAAQRSALGDNLQNAAADREAHAMLAVVLIVCAGVALLSVAAGLALRYGTWTAPTVRRRPAGLIIGGVATALVVVGLAAGVPDKLSRAWHDFKQPTGPGETTGRFASASGNGRYQWWSAALDANSSAPLTGTGPGTFEFWWSEHGTLPGFVRNAHSLYFETAAELGIPGLALLLAALGTVFVVGIGKLRRADPYQRALLAAALAAAAGFATAAAIDWVWQVTVIPVAFLLLAAAILRSSADDQREMPTRLGGIPQLRVALVCMALASLVVIALPMLAVSDARQSQTDVRAGRLSSALDEARSAGRLEPFAATPSLQRALVLELKGDLAAASAAAREATRRESTNWRTWLVLSRIEAERGASGSAVHAYRTARSLNPRSVLFADTRRGSG